MSLREVRTTTSPASPEASRLPRFIRYVTVLERVIDQKLALYPKIPDFLKSHGEVISAWIRYLNCIGFESGCVELRMKFCIERCQFCMG